MAASKLFSTRLINIPLLLVTGIVIALSTYLGLKRLTITTNVMEALPGHERVISDALEIFQNHPIHDQIAIDLQIDADLPDILVESAGMLKAKMQQSKLFAETGLDTITALLPELTQHIVANLPVLFSAAELDQLSPRLTDQAIAQRLGNLIESIGSLEGIGQSALIGSDPLGLKDLVFARLTDLVPTSQATIYKGNLLSTDRRHLLLICRPAASSTDTATARQLSAFFDAAQQELAAQHLPAGVHLKLTPTGAYRAALDNEEIIRHDVQLALGLTTAGIALLLLFALPRPLMSLLSLVPAVAGTAVALLVYSFFYSSISIMVLGFSGALISIMDDHSITYLLFFDRPTATRGDQAAKELQSVGGIMALLTTVVAFVVLAFSSFPVFAELGKFTALGFIFNYLFIHFVFPKIMPVMPAATRKRTLPLHRLSNWMFSFGKAGAIVGLAFMTFLLFFAKPNFRIDMGDMNTVSVQTREADTVFAKTWGTFDQKIYLMTSAATREQLQQQSDELLSRLETDSSQGSIKSAFVPSMIFPGTDRSSANLAAWKNFWSNERVSQVKRQLIATGAALGFAHDAFAGFFAQLDSPAATAVATSPSKFDQLLGIAQQPSGNLVQFISITAGNSYDPVGFQQRYSQYTKIFDGANFSRKLADILYHTFISSLAVIASAVSLLTFVYFLNWRLAVMSLLPMLFAYICSLGTLNLIGQPLDIPSLMLSVVILGMGIDYSLYVVCGCQWYGGMQHPSHLLVKSAVILSAATTLIGFGALCFAEHSLLRSIGITSLCGIGYSLIGACLLLPPLLDRYFQTQSRPLSGDVEERILARYRLLEAYPRIFARCKLRFDPLFQDLESILTSTPNLASILDIGCGFGVPACWLQEKFPDVHITGIDPDPERVRVAALATGGQGRIVQTAAPDLPDNLADIDLVMLLDMLHYLGDMELEQTLRAARSAMKTGGLLVIRFVIRPEGKRSLYWYIEDLRARRNGITTCYRSPESLKKMAQDCGYAVQAVSASNNPELFWLIGNAQ